MPSSCRAPLATSESFGLSFRAAAPGLEHEAFRHSRWSDGISVRIRSRAYGSGQRLALGPGSSASGPSPPLKRRLESHIASLALRSVDVSRDPNRRSSSRRTPTARYDLNPIELAFSKLKALLRAKAIRAVEAL
jgi:hypothetical protein